MDKQTVVITGANSGIGNAWARLLINEGYEVQALDAVAGPTLLSLPCTTHQLDVTDSTAITEFAQKFGAEKPLHFLLNVAGIMPPTLADTLEGVTPQMLAQTYAVNAIGPLMLTKALLGNLLVAKRTSGASSLPKVAIVTSRVGSLSDNHMGGSYAYRASKAAANMLFLNLALDLKVRGIAVLMLHPGIVKSGIGDLSTYDAKDMVEPSVATEGLWRNVVLKKGLEDGTGRFWHREGWEIPW